VRLRPGVAAFGDDGQASEVEVPTIGVVGDGVLGQSAVREPHPGLLTLGYERDLDRVEPAGMGWPGSSHPKVKTTFSSGTTSTNSPTPGCTPSAMTRYRPPGTGFEFGLGAHPQDVLDRIGQEGEDRGRDWPQSRLLALLQPSLFPLSRSADSAR
jgi:hypothetical protein